MTGSTTRAAAANAGRPWPMPGNIDTEGKSLWELVEARAARTPDKVMAVDEQDRTWTYEEFRGACERVAAGLAARGVGEGTNVSWILPSRIEAFVLIGALARLGAVQNPILPIYRHREVGLHHPPDRLRAARRARARSAASTTRRWRAKPPKTSRSRSSSPTPICPKAIPPRSAHPRAAPATRCAGSSTRRARWPTRRARAHSDASIAAANLGMQWSLRCDPTDKVAVVFPITHVGGVVWMFNTMETGAELLLVEVFSVEDSPVFLARKGVTVAAAGTVFWQAYLAAQRKQPDVPLFPEVRVFAGGGAPKPPHIHYELMAEMGAPAIAGWGLTESPINTMMELDSPDDKKATTEGKACPGVELRVVTVDGALAAPGEEGEMQVRGRQVCLGYLDASLDADGVHR